MVKAEGSLLSLLERMKSQSVRFAVKKKGKRNESTLFSVRD